MSRFIGPSSPSFWRAHGCHCGPRGCKGGENWRVDLPAASLQHGHHGMVNLDGYRVCWARETHRKGCGGVRDSVLASEWVREREREDRKRGWERGLGAREWVSASGSSLLHFEPKRGHSSGFRRADVLYYCSLEIAILRLHSGLWACTGV